MSELDRVLEDAYEAQTERKKQLEASVDELRQIGKKGDQAGRFMQSAGKIALGLGFTACIAIMVYEPDARGPCLLLLLFLVERYFRAYKRANS
ncbi:MAG: hypothetical protein KC910_06240 [Candidatus Eremiobacteraeota bacterium]|nr:hypothetical protein [Candidatus Eremiobacteraeota bacterium]